jgi:inner membrane protein
MKRLLVALKFAAILFITLLLLLPMARIRSLVHERQALRDQVMADVARSDAAAQTLTGPLLIVPYTRTLIEQQFDDNRRPVTVTREAAGELRLLPALLDVKGDLATEERRRGIYRARLYRADTRLTGHFEIPANLGITADIASYRFGQPRLVLGISDIRGIGNALTLRAGDASIPFAPGTGTELLASGVQAPLAPFDTTQSRQIDFDIALLLTGTGEFNLMPAGRETHAGLKSDWPHPSFIGQFLPRTREVTDQGFSADWQTSFFATNLAEKLARCGNVDAKCEDFAGTRFGVSFIDPVDQYLKSERAAKYAFLFIGLTFAGFLLTEVLRRVSVHPIQYGLVGLALAMFFLLLLSFAEHIGFGAAYAVSAAACVALIGYYVSHVLANRAQGMAFGVALAALYGLLYMILSSEDYALLMGSLLVFGLLAVVMVLTRRVSWSNWGEAARPGN